MEADMFSDVKIKEEEEELEEAFNEIMDQEHATNEFMDSETLEEAIKLDAINGDDLLGGEEMTVKNHLPDKELQFQNILNKYTHMRKTGNSKIYI